MLLYSAAKAVIKPATGLLWSPRIEGSRHVPEHGPAILASNHLALIDPLFIGVAAPREVVFLAKQELFTRETLPSRVFAAALRSIGQLPVERSPGQGSHQTMTASLELLAQGAVLGVFPEGTRSPDGRLYRGYTGLAWLALTSQAPVIPVALSATQHVLTPGRPLPSFHRVGVRFGPAVDLAPWHGRADSARARREATEAVMRGIHRLSGQQRAERFAASVKRRSAAE